MTDVVSAHRHGAHPILADMVLPTGSPAITARSPIRWKGDHGAPGSTPDLGRDTVEVLGLGDAEIGRLAAGRVITTTAQGSATATASSASTPPR